MKRPLAVIGFSGMIAQCLAMWLHPSFSLIAGAALLGVGMILLLQRSVPALRTAALAAGVVMLLTGGMQWVKVEPVRALDGMTAEVIGTVADQNASDGVYLTVRDARIVSADGRTLAERQKLRIYLSAPIDAVPYDQVTLRHVRLTAPRDGFGLTARGHYESMGIYVTGAATAYDASVSTPEQRPWTAFISDARAAMQRAVRTMLPEAEAGIIDAMVLGDRQSLSVETQTAFRRCGLSALLVVSGLHLSYLIGGLMQLLTGVLRVRRVAAALCIPATVLVMALTGFNGSGIRAGTTMLIYLVGIVLIRVPDPINSLGAAAMVLLAAQPMCAGNIGVQLSFLSTAGILYWSKKWTAWIVSWLPAWAQHGRAHAVIAACAVSAAATAATAPLTAMAFGEWSVIGVGMNLLAAIPAQILLIGGACAAGFGALGWTALARPAAWCAGQMARLLRFGTSVGSRCPMLTDPDGLLTAWAALVLAVAGVLLICGASRKARRIAAICCAVLLAIPVWSSVRPREELTAVRCGDGLAVCVATGGRRILLLDGTSASLERNVCRAFSGVSIDEVLILSADAEVPARTAAALARAHGVRRIYYAGADCPDALRRVDDACAVRPIVEWARPAEMRRIFPGSDGGWVRIGPVLVAYGTADASDLPVSMVAPAVWVTSEAPDGAETIRAQATILSCAGWTELQRLSRLVPACGTVFTTAQNGTVRVPLDEKGVRVWRS